jgi:hypothetical protein
MPSFTVEWLSCKRYRGKRTQPKRLDGASVRDPSLNLPQGGEVDNRLRINHPHSQAPPEWRSSDEENVMGRRRLVGEKIFAAPSHGGEK